MVWGSKGRFALSAVNWATKKFFFVEKRISSYRSRFVRFHSNLFKEENKEKEILKFYLSWNIIIYLFPFISVDIFFYFTF